MNATMIKPVVRKKKVPLPVCRWRGPELHGDRYACRSIKVSTVSGGVTGYLCRRCSLCDHKPVPGLKAWVRQALKRAGINLRFYPPKSVRLLITFSRALTRHAKDLFRLVPRAEYERRLRVCTGDPTTGQPKCQHYLKDNPGGRCGKCGCGMRGQVGDAGDTTPLPWYRLVARVRRRWGKVWGKAWWKSEDCPVCSRCGGSKQGKKQRCTCPEFISKWRVGLTTIPTEDSL